MAIGLFPIVHGETDKTHTVIGKADTLTPACIPLSSLKGNQITKHTDGLYIPSQFNRSMPDGFTDLLMDGDTLNVGRTIKGFGFVYAVKKEASDYSVEKVMEDFELGELITKLGDHHPIKILPNPVTLLGTGLENKLIGDPITAAQMGSPEWLGGREYTVELSGTSLRVSRKPDNTLWSESVYELFINTANNTVTYVSRILPTANVSDGISAAELDSKGTRPTWSNP